MIAEQKGISRKSLSIHLLQFADALSAIWVRLQAAGGTPETARAQIAENLKAACHQCQIALSGEELALAATTERDCDEASPKLKRIFQGYCARANCDCSYYDLSFPETGSVPWETICSEAAHVTDARTAGQPAKRSGPSLAAAIKKRFKPWEIGAAVGVFVVLAVVLWWQFRTPSWSTRSSGYTVDPSSVSAPGGPAQ